MNRLILAGAVAALMIGTSGVASAATSADCQALFQKADVNKDGSLQAEESKVFVDAMSKAQVVPAEAAMVKQEEFMTACEKDAFASIDPATVGTAQSTEAPAEQPAATTEQSTAATSDQPSTTEPAATAEQTTTTTTDPAQPSATQPSTTSEATQPTTTGEATQSAEQPAEQALAVPEAFMASDLIGANIYSASNENLAEVKDIVLSKEGGQATHAIIDVGDKDVAVALAQLKIVATTNGFKVMVDASKADLEAMPAYGKQ
jgi:hypothetical protein